MSEQWKGIGKLIEECGELIQVAGKAVPFPVGEHPDGKGAVCGRFVEEIADVYAALDYFRETNGLNEIEIAWRRKMKLDKFKQWGLTGVQVQS